MNRISIVALFQSHQKRDYRRVQVSSVSLDALCEDFDNVFEPAIDGFTVLFQDSTDLYKCLTKRQREVERLLAKGYTRKEVAAKRVNGVQTVHQMVLVMRKRIRAYMEKQSVAWEYTIIIENLVYLVYLACLAHPRATAMHLHRNWNLHPVFREYEQPSCTELQIWVKKATVQKGETEKELIARLKRDFLAYYQELPVKTAGADFIGRSDDTINTWEKNDPEVAEAVKNAKAEYARKHGKGRPDNLLPKLYENFQPKPADVTVPTAVIINCVNPTD